MSRTTRFIFATLLASTAVAHAATDGQVTKVDKATSRVTLKHGEIKNLDMPAMTMAFRVKDAAWLDKLAVGDKVRFSAEKVDGQYVLTEIAPAP